MLNRYFRQCTRCNDFYYATGKQSKTCEDCSDVGNHKIWWDEKKCWGYKKCPKWLKMAYLKGAKNKCSCGKRGIEVHRIIRGNQGGLYTVAKLNSRSNNVQVLCKACHKIRHSKEF